MAVQRFGGLPCLMPRLYRAAGDDSDEELRGRLMEFVGELAGQRRCLCSGIRTGPPQHLVGENCVPYAFGERDRQEKPEKDDDYDTLFDRTA